MTHQLRAKAGFRARSILTHPSQTPGSSLSKPSMQVAETTIGIRLLAREMAQRGKQQRAPETTTAILLPLEESSDRERPSSASESQNLEPNHDNREPAVETPPTRGANTNQMPTSSESDQTSPDANTTPPHPKSESTQDAHEKQTPQKKTTHRKPKMNLHLRRNLEYYSPISPLFAPPTLDGLSDVLHGDRGVQHDAQKVQMIQEVNHVQEMLELLDVREREIKELRQQRDEGLNQLQFQLGQIQSHEDQNHGLRIHLEETERLLLEREDQIREREAQLALQEEKLQVMEDHLEQKEAMLNTATKTTKELRQQVENRDKQIREISKQLLVKGPQLQEKAAALVAVEEEKQKVQLELEAKEQQLQDLSQQLKANEELLAEFQQSLLAREKQIEELRRKPRGWKTSMTPIKPIDVERQIEEIELDGPPDERRERSERQQRPEANVSPLLSIKSPLKTPPGFQPLSPPAEPMPPRKPAWGGVALHQPHQVPSQTQHQQPHPQPHSQLHIPPRSQPHTPLHPQPHSQLHTPPRSQPHTPLHPQPHSQLHTPPRSQPHTPLHPQPHLPPHSQPHPQPRSQQHHQTLPQTQPYPPKENHLPMYSQAHMPPHTQAQPQVLPQRSRNVPSQALPPESVPLKWKKCAKAPAAMIRGAATVKSNMAYFRPGGLAREIYVYDSDQEEWSTLPPCPHSEFALVVISGVLTAVGGFQTGQGATNCLMSLMEADEWRERFRPMPTKRAFPAVTTVSHYLVVAGGQKELVGGELSTVEVMDTNSSEWRVASALPHPLSDISMSFCAGSLYLMGGLDENGRTRSVFSCAFRALLQSCHPPQRAAQMRKLPSLWFKVADSPAYLSTCTTYRGQLMSVGGCDAEENPTNTLYAYNASSNSWHIVSNMPTARYWPLVVPMAGNKLTVVGGFMAVAHASDIVEMAILV